MLKNRMTFMLLLALNLLTAVPLFALTTSRPLGDGVYERREVQFILNSETSLQAHCDLGDEVISGSCSVSNRVEFPNEIIHGVRVNSALAGDKKAWSCEVRRLDPRPELRLISAVKCKKNGR